MGYVLLWIENLAVSLLFIATVIACVARIHRRWPRTIIWAFAGFVIFLAYLALTIATGIIKFHFVSDFVWFYPALTLMFSYIVGVIWLRYAGLRKKGDEQTTLTAATWPRGKLAMAFGIAVALHFMTLWNLDLEARQQAASLRVEAGALAMSATPPRVPDNDNAALLYEQAGQALDIAIKGQNGGDKASWNKWIESMDKSDLDPKDPELDKFFNEQSGIVSLMLEAAKKPGCYFEHDYNRPNINMIFPEIQPARSLARLLALHARWKASKNDYKAAMEDINAIFIIARHIGIEPFLISGLAGCAIDGISLETLKSMVASHQLGLEELNIVKLDSAFSYQKLMLQAFQYEEAFRLTFYFDASNNIGYISTISSPTYRCGNDFGASFIFRIFMLDNEIKVDRWYSEKVNRLAIKPYYQAKNGWYSKAFNSGPQSFLSRLIFPAYQGYVQGMTRGDANRRVAELALAMCRYRAKNGKFPEKLDALVPDYILFVPLDPFDGQPIRLKQTEDKLVIYSVGTDGIDDGGAPYDKQTRKGDITFELPNKRD